ncbi:MAG: hypothetical protein ACFCUG_15930 [Thiotrichales bacterium]
MPSRARASDQIFHITLKGGERTSFSLDKYLSELLALKLGHLPHTREAHSAIRGYLIDALTGDVAFDPELPLSRQARRKAIAAIANEEWVRRHGDWVIGALNDAEDQASAG